MQLMQLALLQTHSCPPACLLPLLHYPSVSLPTGPQLAANAQLYVNDAFGTAHRAHASTEGVTKFLKPSVSGFLLQKVRAGYTFFLCFCDCLVHGHSTHMGTGQDRPAI